MTDQQKLKVSLWTGIISWPILVYFIYIYFYENFSFVLMILLNTLLIVYFFGFRIIAKMKGVKLMTVIIWILISCLIISIPVMYLIGDITSTIMLMILLSQVISFIIFTASTIYKNSFKFYIIGLRVILILVLTALLGGCAYGVIAEEIIGVMGFEAIGFAINIFILMIISGLLVFILQFIWLGREIKLLDDTISTKNIQ